MERFSRRGDRMINLFEYFNLPSAELYQSLQLAGNNHPTIVIEDDGFLPDNIITPYRYFANYHPEPTKALYFNAVKKPKYWEIDGNNSEAHIKDNGRTKANIIYKMNYKSRIVERVEWLGDNNNVRYIDHYTKHGLRFAQTVNDIHGKSIMKTYFTKEGKVVIYENYITGSIMLTLDDKEYIFSNKAEFITYFIDQLNVDTSKIIFNSLSLPLIAIYNRKQRTHGYLFWQEQVQDALPGNMVSILESNNHLSFKVIVPNKLEYARITTLTKKELRHKIKQSGYLYQYHRKNTFTKNVLTMTNSDQLPHVEHIIKNSPDYTFTIAAITEMSSKLMNLGKYKNVKLYPSVELNKARQLYEAADIYLDINQGNEIMNAVRSAYDYDHLIMGYKETAHNVTYTNNAMLVSEREPDLLLEYLHMKKSEKEAALKKQKSQASEVSVEMFNGALDIIKT